jgi:hypothetical protein
MEHLEMELKLLIESKCMKIDKKELHFFYGFFNSIQRYESYMQLKFENFERFINSSLRFPYSIEGESFWIGVSQTDFNTKEVTNEQK